MPGLKLRFPNRTVTGNDDLQAEALNSHRTLIEQLWIPLRACVESILNPRSTLTRNLKKNP